MKSSSTVLFALNSVAAIDVVHGFHVMSSLHSAEPRSAYQSSRPVQIQYMMDPSSSLQLALTTATTTTTTVSSSSSDLSLQNKDVLVFIAGIIPFAWATVEFWRRIAVGEPFGTGRDSVYIGKDNAPNQSRGRQTLDRGAFVVAYILFAIAAGAIGLTLYSVMTSVPLPDNV